MGMIQRRLCLGSKEKWLGGYVDRSRHDGGGGLYVFRR